MSKFSQFEVLKNFRTEENFRVIGTPDIFYKDIGSKKEPIYILEPISISLCFDSYHPDIKQNCLIVDKESIENNPKIWDTMHTNTKNLFCLKTCNA